MASIPLKTLVAFKRLSRSRRHRSRPPTQVTAIDVDGQFLRLVQTSPRGNRTVVTRLEAVPLELATGADRTDPNVLGQAIAKTLNRLNFKPASVVMGVSRAQVVLRTLTLPVLEDIHELASMVHFQVGRDLPFRMDEAVIDFKVRRQISIPPPRSDSIPAEGPATAETKLETTHAPKLEVLVAAVKRDVVDFYLQVTEAAGLKLTALGLLSYANARCLDACNVAEGDQAVALVSLRPDEMNIDVIAQQTLLFSRGASVKPSSETPLPPPDTTSLAKAEPAGADATTPLPSPAPESFADAVTIEVIRSMHSYSGMEPNNPVTKVAVTGATGHEAAVVEALGKRLSTPCSLLDLATALDLPSDAREQTPGGIAPIGLALGVSDPKGLPFDFLNPKRPAVQRDMRRIRILAGIAAAAAVLIFTLALRTFLINRHENIRAELAAELAEAEKKSPLYRQMTRQATVHDGWVKGGRDWLQQFAYLSAILPPSEEVYVTSLAISGAGTIRLNVQARSGETLAKLEKQLSAAGYDVKPLAITPGADRHGYEFRSSVEFTAPEKMKIDLSKVKTPPRLADDASLDPFVKKGGVR